MRSMIKMILNYHNQSDQVPTMMETRHDNYVIDYTYAVYAKKTKISCNDQSDKV